MIYGQRFGMRRDTLCPDRRSEGESSINVAVTKPDFAFGGWIEAMRMKDCVLVASIFAWAVPFGSVNATVYVCDARNQYSVESKGTITSRKNPTGSLKRIIVDSRSGEVIDEKPLPTGMRWELAAKYEEKNASIKFIGYDHAYNATLALAIFANSKGAPFLYLDLRSGLIMDGVCKAD